MSAHPETVASFRCLRSFPTTRIEMAKKKVDDKNNQNPDSNKNETEMSTTDEEPNFSDPEGYEDDIAEEGM